MRRKTRTSSCSNTTPNTQTHAHQQIRDYVSGGFHGHPPICTWFQWQEPALELDISWKECTPPPPPKKNQKHKLWFTNQESKQRADIPPKTMQLMRNRLPSAIENLPDQRWLHNCLIQKYSKLVVFLEKQNLKMFGGGGWNSPTASTVLAFQPPSASRCVTF